MNKDIMYLVYCITIFTIVGFIFRNNDQQMLIMFTFVAGHTIGAIANAIRVELSKAN